MTTEWRESVIFDVVTLRVMGIAAYARDRMQEAVPFPLEVDGDTVSAGTEGFVAEYGRGSEPGTPWVMDGIRRALGGGNA